MEDEERQKKLEAGKAKLAEYRQRKAHADSQKKQKKKKKKKSAEESEGDAPGGLEVQTDQSVGGEKGSGEERDESQEGDKDPPTKEFTFARTLRSGETVQHDQTYTIEPESEVSSTAEDYSSEEEEELLQQVKTTGGKLQEMDESPPAKTPTEEELNEELEEIKADFDADGVQQLQDFEAALRQRDGIITRLTANLQQARQEKDEIMKEFLKLTEQSQKLQIQFQQLQAGETLRNTSHSSTAADLLQARQQLTQYQKQQEETNAEVKRLGEKSGEQQENIGLLQRKLSEMETSGRRSEESFTQRMNEMNLLIAEQEKTILSQEKSLTELRMAEDKFAQTLEGRNLFISEQTAIITEHEVSLTLLREELSHLGPTADKDIGPQSDEKDLIIAEQEKVISGRDCSLAQLEDKLELSEKLQRDLQRQVAAGESELVRCMGELESTKSDLEICRSEIESCKLQLEREQKQAEVVTGELAASRQKERMSSNEIMQLMGTVEDLQKRNHQGSLSESGTVQKMQDDTVRKLELLRAELDEMYGQQIVQMKQELNLQYAARLEQIDATHQSEVELLKARLISESSAISTVEANSLNTKIMELQETLEQSQAMLDKAREELRQITQEKFNLQTKVENLLQDLRSAKEKLEQVSQSVISQESQQLELLLLQETIDRLRSELAVAEEVAEEVEVKHESEITNYKIKLEMLEREKDAVLDRMAQSQEAELDRLRTQLLFSHEEELISLREQLQMESFLNTENLLNEAAVKHDKALDVLRVGYEEKLLLLQKENSGFSTERDELLHEILELKEDLKLATHGSKAEELVQQLQELQVELEELRKGEEEAQMRNQIRTLLKKVEVLEKQSKEQERCWENQWKEQNLEKEILVRSNKTLEEDLHSKVMKMETLTAEKNEMQQQVADLSIEIDKARTTFSFAEKNFEVNYQELKVEYTCLTEAKTRLEEKTLKETLEFEAKIASLQVMIRNLEEGSRRNKTEKAHTEMSGRAATEKDTTELMEKLNVTLSEKESLSGRLSRVTEQLRLTEGKVVQLEEELLKVGQEKAKVSAQNESLRKDLVQKQGSKREQARGKLQQVEKTAEPVSSSEDHHSQIQSLQKQIKTLQSLLNAAESERNAIRQTLDLQRLPQTPSPAAAAATAAAVRSSREAPVEGRSSPQKSTASGSNRRKRRQKSKQERKALSDCRDKQQREEEEEEEEVEEGGAVAEVERATSAADSETQSQMESQVVSCSPERAGMEDSADGCQGDEGRDYIIKQVSRHGSSRHTEPAECLRAEEDMETTQHGDCRLQMEAQRISLSQIHAAQLELLQEETNVRRQSLELRLQDLKDQGGREEPKTFKYQNVLQAVSQECSEIIQCFKKVFGESFLSSVDAETQQLPSVKEPETSESISAVLEARELYRALEQVREKIEWEHLRLSQLQVLLRADGDKMMELQTANEELRSSSRKEIADLLHQVSSLTSSENKDVVLGPGAPSTSPSEEILRRRAEEQEKQLQLEDRHRQEVERLRSHYQQQTAETEERFLTELIMLQKRLQEVTGTQTQTQTQLSVPESSPGRMEEHTEGPLKDPSEEQLPEGGGGVELRWPAGSAGPTAQLQSQRLRSRELKRLREQGQPEQKREERLEERGEEEQDLKDSNGAGWSGAAGQVVLEEKQDWERVEEEVAKAIVQMSVKFAQQTELARINKRAGQRCTSMQTQSDEDEEEGREEEEQTPGASHTSDARLEEVEKERLERELEGKSARIRELKEELQKTKTAAEQSLKKKEDAQEGSGGPGAKVSSQDDGYSLDTTAESSVLRKANEKLSQVLVEVLKTTAAAEETMGLHTQSLGASSGAPTQRTTSQRVDPAPDGHPAAGLAVDAAAEDVRLWSGDEGPETAQQMMERLTEPENEEYLMGVSSRLQTALENMLMTITDTTDQLEHARLTQTELMRESFRHNQEINELLQKQEELQERLAEEARAREELALELHRAEGLIDGYTGERAALDERLRQKEELQLSLDQELRVTGSRLHELEQERLQMQEERELLSRQQDAMKETAGPRELCLVEAAMVAAPEADLLEETEKLMKEKVEVQRQAEKENSDLLKQVKLLEAELEEQVNRVIELEQTQRTESGDLQQQVQALEKQLEKNRRFLDEQAVDREHERDFFQQEIQKLEQQLKSSQKLQPGSEQRNQQVDRLTSQLKEKADWCSELLLSSEQLHRELGERNEEIDKLESRIRELEQALLANNESLEKVEEKTNHASITEAKGSALETQLQTEREALDRKEKEICNLEEQLEQFREELENKSEEVQQLHMQLEIQRKEISSQQEYLETRDGMIQVMEQKDREIALLNEKLTKLRHMETASDNKEMDDRDELVKDLESLVQCLQSEQQRLKRNNEEELEQLNAVIDRLQQELANIEQKQAAEEDEDAEPESGLWGPISNQYVETKQRTDLVTKELDSLKKEHGKLLETYGHLKESAGTERLQNLEEELEEALREKTAGLVVMQAQIQALEQSATSRVEELDLRIQELEELVDEKDSELGRCRLLVQQTQSHADALQQNVSNLENNLREKMAAVLVSQATLEALQQQQSERSNDNEDRQRHAEPHVETKMDPHLFHFGIPQMDFSGITQARPVPTGKVGHLTERLRELEVGLSGMQKDQELQKQLLSSSEEEVLEYERRLSVLMDLLSQMKARTHQRMSPAVGTSSAHDQPPAAEALQELLEVSDEASSTKEQLYIYKERCRVLQEELRERNVTIEKLQHHPTLVSSGGHEESKVSEVLERLLEAQNETAAAKEELSSCRESLDKFQELLQEREMTIAHLKGELFQVRADEDTANVAELLQEDRNDAASNKEEVDSWREHNEKRQQDLRLRDASISKLNGELQEMRQDMDTTKEELNCYRQHNENLQEDLQLRDASNNKLNEELQEMRQNMDTTEEELNCYRQRNENLHEDLQLHEASISKLNHELQEIRQNMDTTEAELKRYSQHNEKLQQDLQLRDASISKLNGELQEMCKNMDTTKEELDSYRQHNEKLQEDLQLRDVSISKLNLELQEMRHNVDTHEEEIDSHSQHNEKLQQDLQLREDSLSRLNHELQEMRQNLDTSKGEHDSYRQQNEKLQQDLQLREDSISRLNHELQEMRQNVDTTKEEIHSHSQHNEKLQQYLQLREDSLSRLNHELQEMRQNVDTTKEEVSSYRQHNEELQEDLHLRDASISKLNLDLQEKRQNVDTTKEEIDSLWQHNEKLQEDLHLRDASISQLNLELQELRHNMDTSKEGLDSYRQQNEKLQEDLQLRDASNSKLNGELQQMRQNVDTTKEEIDSLWQHNEKLQQDIQLREDSLSRLNHELQEMRQNVDTTKEEVSSYRQQNEELQEDRQIREFSISKLNGELQEMRQSLDAIKEELGVHRQHEEKLQDELRVREISISKLEDELQEVRTALMKTADSVPASPSPSSTPSPAPQPLSSSSSTTQPKRKGGKQLAGKGTIAKEKPSLSKKNSSSFSQSSNKTHSVRLNSSVQQQHVSLTHSSSQTEPLHIPDLSPEGESTINDEMEEIVGEFQEKIAQMQELHAAEILDMEARHITESDGLRRDMQALEDDCKALKSLIDKLRSAKTLSSRHDRPPAQFKDGYTSDSSSDYSQRTGFDIPSLQQEFRTTPEGARRENEDPLPDRIKTLLREVHQEGMQVLSLSEVPVCEAEPGGRFSTQDWVKEREELLAMVEALKGLIAQMQTQREAQTSGSEDWRAELLDAVRRVFVRERCVLKSALYSLLDQLDTSDAIVHLNQLELRLAEQDAQHREATASLCSADRSSLLSEIQQLRDQLQLIHEGARPAPSVDAECILKEQRVGGGVDEGEELLLLVEELKAELSQTKLELETTIKSQHKHLRELDTLRAEVSQKAAEIDALNDQLTEERKRSRDLQWAMEKERCRTGRNEESKQEELEDLQLGLEEERGLVAQLTLTLEQERQASTQLSQEAEQMHLSLHSRLQELQVQLETEQAKALELNTALERERELRTGVSAEGGEVKEGTSLLERLQRDLDTKHEHVVHLLGQVEAQRLEVVRKEEELTLRSQRSRQDQEALMEAQAQLKRLEARLSESQKQLEREVERRKSLEEDKDGLEEKLNRLRERGGTEGRGPLQTESHTQTVRIAGSSDRTKDWVLRQKSGNDPSSSSPHLEASPTDAISGQHRGPWRTMDKILAKLHLVSSKVRSMTTETSDRPALEVDSEDMSWVQCNIDEVITMLQESPAPPAVHESPSPLAGGSSPSLTERLLRQNAELTGFVSRLTEEKNDLRNHTLRLEEEVRRYRQAGLGSADNQFSRRRGGSNVHSWDMMLSQEREAWTRERVRLEKALLLVQAQVARLKAEIRNDALREINGPEADNAALKRMYGKYLRSESFRKALIYQKKYLLLLLGGFQECEEATLSLLTRMGSRPSQSSQESLGQRRRGLTRFRSAVRVSIALSRMRFLVKRWHKATGMTSTTSYGVNKNGTGQTLGTDVRDSPYLHPGGVEMYKERGGGGGASSSRGRSGRESPRSAVSSTHHRFHLAGDHGALTCSHLQSYDPDRALTDYISRLEALQRRLGSVTSGSPPYAQLHFGLRR